MTDEQINTQANEILQHAWQACDGKQAAAVFVAGANMCVQASKYFADSGMDVEPLLDWLAVRVRALKPTEVVDVG